MMIDDLVGWVDAGYGDVSKALRPKSASDWWPPSGKNGQGFATTWAWAVVLHAANARCPKDQGQIMFSAPFHGKKHEQLRSELVRQVWTSNGTRRTHNVYEIVLDFSVHDWQANSPVLLTAESEMFAGHGVGDELTRAHDYSWDFFKLMLVRSPLRLFLARVGAIGNESGCTRRDALVASLKHIVELYGEQLLHERDELGGVVLPEDRTEWRDARFFVVNGAGFTEAKPWT